MKKPILLFAFLFLSTITFAQLSEVLYKIEYNETTDLFDCKMYIVGSATSVADRTQLPAQYSVVVETGAAIAIEQTYLPVYNNETYTGTIPMDWSIQNTAIDPVEFPGYDVYAVVPNLSGQPSHYNDLNWEDVITLFSLSAVGPDICSLSLRAFENDDDPNIIGGIDFTNSMMIGSTDEIYTYNLQPNNISDVDITINQGSICQGECITLTATFNCIFPGLTYEWSTDETTESIVVCPEESQGYTLNLSGPFEFSKKILSYIDVDQGIWADGDLITDLCLGVQQYYLPENGIWASSDDNIVTVTSEGSVNPISVGSATISHTNASGNCLDEIVVNVTDPEPPTILGDVEICEGETTQLYPSTGVTWSSGNSAIATVDNTGLVTGVGIGSTVFTYTTAQGCISEPTSGVNVLIIPEPLITGMDTICVGGATELTPNAGTIWFSSDPSVATIDNSGKVTGVSEGSTSFYFTDMSNGCTSGESDPISVLPSPIVQLSADSVCQGENVIASSNFEGGSWDIIVVSGSPLIASIDSETGEIETVESGVINVQHISKDGCISDENLLTILPTPNPQITNNSPYCIGENIVLSATTSQSGNYSYQWIWPDGSLTDKTTISIPNANLNDSGIYSLIISENGCDSERVDAEVYVADCDPCEDMTAENEWIKVPVLSEARNYNLHNSEVGSSLVTGRDLEDFVFYHYFEHEIRLIKNSGHGFFDEEITLFELLDLGDNAGFDIIDIDQDGLNDIVTYQLDSISQMIIRVFQNKDNFTFEDKLMIVDNTGTPFTYSPIKYLDLDNQGFLDIIPNGAPVHFTDNWEATSINLPDGFLTSIVDDFNEDGLLDILGPNSEMLINDGDRNFSMTTMDGDAIVKRGLYDYDTGIYTNGMTTYQITKGSTPSVTICNELPIPLALSYFFANINSKSSRNALIALNQGFQYFEDELICDDIPPTNTILKFNPRKDDRIDLTNNGYTDFIFTDISTYGELFAWINPNDQPKISGTAFIDNNGDGILNENDIPLRNVLISIEPGILSVLTDDDGHYEFLVAQGTYTLTANINEGAWIMDVLSIENVVINQPCNIGYDFGFEPDLLAPPNVNLSMVNTIARCDFETKFTITVENTGSEPFESQLLFEFDDKTTFFSTEIIGAIAVGNTVTTDIGPLDPFQPQQYKITVKMPSGSSVLPMLDFKVTLINEFGIPITEYGYTEQLKCSYDPNDKREFPDREGFDNLTLMDEDLEYTIRFQNNGNDTAYNVKIVDRLDNNIDPRSIRVVAASHAVETCVDGPDLIFFFENIYLVDSTTDYPSSQGYVTFKCNAKEGQAEFTVVNNSAEIFFDTNLPISTNQTINTLVSELCKNESTLIVKNICDGEEYLGHSESGIYLESFDLLFGCDSVVTINLTVQGITYAQQSFDLCGAGTINFGSEDYFIDSSTTIIDTLFNDQGCISSIIKFEITLVPDFIESQGGLEFCVNETGSIFPDLEGYWTSDDESVILIDEEGNITAVNPGYASLQFTDYETGCLDEISIVVHSEPTITNEGNEQICIDETNQLSSDNEGIWATSDPDIATITNDGLVIGKEAGNVIFYFTSNATGCSKSIAIEVLPSSDLHCIVSTKDLSSESVIIYPNPASGFIFIESKKVWNTIRLINAQGQIVLVNELGDYQAKKKIDLNGFSSGLYFILLESENAIDVQRFVVD